MSKKVQIPVVGGLRKSVTVGGSTAVGTTIAELGSATVSLAQLKALLGLLDDNNSGTISDVPTPAILVGPGLSGGGPVLGIVPINLIGPIPTFITGEVGQIEDPASAPVIISSSAPIPPVPGATTGVSSALARDGIDGEDAIAFVSSSSAPTPPVPGATTGVSNITGRDGIDGEDAIVFASSLPPIVAGPQGPAGPLNFWDIEATSEDNWNAFQVPGGFGNAVFNGQVTLNGTGGGAGASVVINNNNTNAGLVINSNNAGTTTSPIRIVQAATNIAGITVQGPVPSFAALDTSANGAFVNFQAGTNSWNLNFGWNNIQPSGTASIQLNGTPVIEIASTRGVVIDAAASGQTLTVNGTVKAAASPLAAAVTQVMTGLANFKSALSTSANATLTTDAALTVTVNEVGWYAIKVFLPCFEATSGAGGFQFDLNGGSATIVAIVAAVPSWATIANSITSIATAVSFGTINTSSTTPFWVMVDGTLHVTVAGTIAVRWAQASILAIDPTTLMAGASIVLTKIG